MGGGSWGSLLLHSTIGEEAMAVAVEWICLIIKIHSTHHLSIPSHTTWFRTGWRICSTNSPLPIFFQFYNVLCRLHISDPWKCFSSEECCYCMLLLGSVCNYNYHPHSQVISMIFNTVSPCLMWILGEQKCSNVVWTFGRKQIYSDAGNYNLTWCLNCPGSSLVCSLLKFCVRWG